MQPRSGPRLALVSILVLLAATTLLALAPPAAAQGLPPCTVLSCAFEVAIVDWNGTGEPSSFLNGTIRITNTGQSEDAYTITVTPDNESWVAEVQPSEVGPLAPEEGVLPSEAETSAEVDVLVHIPAEAPAGSETGIRITVASVNDDGLDEQSIVLAATTRQVYAWSLSCTGGTEIEKARSGTIELIATNRGNGRDRATVATAPLAGLQMDEPAAFDLAAGNTSLQEIELGVGLSLEDGDYTLRWDLASTNASDATASCTTTLTVTGGNTSPPDEDDPEESPMPVGIALFALLFAGALARRRRPGRSP